MKPKLYLDIDGVFADFASTYQSLLKIYSEKDHWKFFHEMVVKHNLFEKLQPLPHAYDLISFVDKLYQEGKIDTPAFLTSAGDRSGVKHVKEAFLQKQGWIKDTLKSDYPVLIVKQKEDKKLFATASSFLLDDTASNVTDFVAKGGAGFIYSDSDFKAATDAISAWLSKA